MSDDNNTSGSGRQQPAPKPQDKPVEYEPFGSVERRSDDSVQTKVVRNTSK